MKVLWIVYAICSTGPTGIYKDDYKVFEEKTLAQAYAKYVVQTYDECYSTLMKSSATVVQKYKSIEPKGE